METHLDSSKAVLRLFELVVDHGEIGVSELARSIQEPKTTVQRGLTTLHEAGWLHPVMVRGRRRWRASLRLAILANKLDPLKGLRAVAIPIMSKLRDECGETIHLTMREGGEVLLVERVDSRQPLRTVRPLGARAPLHVTANGKAILAALPPEEAEQYSRAGLAGWTERSFSDPDALADDLELTRRRGYACSYGEMDIHIRAVGAVILEGDAPIAALSISCPASRLSDDMMPHLGRQVADAAARVSQALA